MTWGGAMPVLAICLIFDALRLLFEQFWFFGPAFAAVVCTIKVGGVLKTVTLGLLGTKGAAAVCGGAASVLAVYGAPIFEGFGVIMAMAVGLFGWLAVGLILIITNARIFEENAGHALWFAASLLISEIPIIGTVPALIIIVWRMYRVQIKKDREALKKYESDHATDLQTDRQQQATEFMLARNMQIMQIQEEEAINDALY